MSVQTRTASSKEEWICGIGDVSEMSLGKSVSWCQTSRCSLIFTYSSPHSGKGQRVILLQYHQVVQIFTSIFFRRRPSASETFRCASNDPGWHRCEHPLKSVDVAKFLPQIAEISQDLIRFNFFFGGNKIFNKCGNPVALLGFGPIISHNSYLFQWKHHVLLDIKNNRFNQRKFNQLAAFWRILEWRSNTSTLSPGGAPWLPPAKASSPKHKSHWLEMNGGFNNVSCTKHKLHTNCMKWRLRFNHIIDNKCINCMI